MTFVIVDLQCITICAYMFMVYLYFMCITWMIH